MKPDRRRSPGPLPTLAAVSVAVAALVALACLELGLIGPEPWGDGGGAPPRARPGPGPIARTKAPRRPGPGPSTAPGPEAPEAVVADEEAGGTPSPPIPPPKPPDRPDTGARGEARRADPPGEAGERAWRKRLGLLHRRMHAKGVDAEAVARKASDEVAAIVDPGAVPSLWCAFAGHPRHHLLVAWQVAKLDSPRSPLLLAALAAYSPDEKARRAAVEGLKSRDPVDYAGPLIALLGPELTYRAGLLPTGPGGPILRALEIEDERFIKQFVYFAGPTPVDPSPWGLGACPTTGASDPSRAAATQELAEFQLRSDVDAVEALNSRIRARNDRVRAVLAEATGRDDGLDRDAWGRWLASKAGKPYIPPERVAKVPFQEFVEPIFQPSFVEVPPVPS